MFPFPTPLLAGGAPPLVRNFVTTVTGDIEHPTGWKKLTVEILSSGARGGQIDDFNEDGWADGWWAGPGGSYARKTILQNQIDGSRLTATLAVQGYNHVVNGNNVILLRLLGPNGRDPYAFTDTQVSGGVDFSAVGASGQAASGGEPEGDVNLSGGAANWNGVLAAAPAGGSSPLPSYPTIPPGSPYGGGGGLSWRPYSSWNTSDPGGGYIRLTWEF